MDKLLELLKTAAAKNPTFFIGILELVVAMLKANPELLTELLDFLFGKKK